MSLSSATALYESINQFAWPREILWRSQSRLQIQSGGLRLVILLTLINFLFYCFKKIITCKMLYLLWKDRHSIFIGRILNTVELIIISIAYWTANNLLMVLPISHNQEYGEHWSLISTRSLFYSRPPHLWEPRPNSHIIMLFHRKCETSEGKY